jgi:hypothetical protein
MTPMDDLASGPEPTEEQVAAAPSAVALREALAFAASLLEPISGTRPPRGSNGNRAYIASVLARPAAAGAARAAIDAPWREELSKHRPFKLVDYERCGYCGQHWPCAAVALARRAGTGGRAVNEPTDDQVAAWLARRSRFSKAEWLVTILAALPAGWRLTPAPPSAELVALREAVDTEWYNGNLDGGARDRILLAKPAQEGEQ